jgi:hypothetical protein
MLNVKEDFPRLQQEEGSFALSYPLSLRRVDRRRKGGNTGLR